MPTSKHSLMLSISQFRIFVAEFFVTNCVSEHDYTRPSPSFGFLSSAVIDV